MREKAIQLVQEGKYDEALVCLRAVIEADPSDWNSVYLAGQCCRFLNDLDSAISYLRKAASINPNEGPIFLALGIACQLKGNWDAAIDALNKALQIDPDYVLAFNSLALTQKRRGELEKADHLYNAGAIALARGIVKGMTNVFDNQIFPHRNSRNDLWTEYAMHGAAFLAVNEDSLESISWPTVKMAEEEERTHKHGGLLWEDRTESNGELVRQFLPNYFVTFQFALRVDRSYSELMGNRGLVLEMLGKQEEAQKHFEEAEDFSPG